MKIFEASDEKGDCIIIANKKEAKKIYEAFEIAYNSNKRKKSFKKILNQFDKQLACF